MRGIDLNQGSLFSYVQLEERIPPTHPLRKIRIIADKALQSMNSKLSERYSANGRPSIPPEKIIKASLLQTLYGIRSEIQLMEQMEYNLLFRWFVGLGVDGKIWTPESFSTNRTRLFDSGLTAQFFNAILAQAKKKKLVSKEHFAVDGTLIKAWASQKSICPKSEEKNNEPKDPGNNGIDFRGEKRSNDTHESKTDPDARMFRKSKGSESMICFMGHALMENRNGLVVDCETTKATGMAEREATLEMLTRRKNKSQKVTLAADKGYDANEFTNEIRNLKVTPHIALKDSKKNGNIDKRTTRHKGYAISIRKRKKIEQIFGWIKSAGCLRQLKVRGMEKVKGAMTMAFSAYNIIRMSNLCELW
jgi:transposase